MTALEFRYQLLATVGKVGHFFTFPILHQLNRTNVRMTSLKMDFLFLTNLQNSSDILTRKLVKVFFVLFCMID